jgi:hypothetical protein
MCTGIIENTRVSGNGKGPQGWFTLDQVSVCYDHPEYARGEHAVIIDFLNSEAGPDSRVAVELTPESAKNLVRAILTSISRGRSGQEIFRIESMD